MKKTHDYSHLVESMKRTIAASTVPEVEPIFIGVDLGADSGDFGVEITYLNKPLNISQIESLKNIDGLLKKIFELIEMANLEIATKNLPLNGISHTFLAQASEQIHNLDFANLTALHRAKRAINRDQQAA